MDVKETVFRFLKEKTKSDALTEETELLKSGLVNSLFALEIVVFVEQTFGVKLKRKDITAENFSSVNRIAALVDRLREGK